MSHLHKNLDSPVATHFSNPHITRKGYIYRFAPERNRWELHSLPSPVLCLDHADSSVWVGTYGEGIFRYNYADWQNFKCDIPSDNTTIGNYNFVNAIQATEENVYCATIAGLAIFNIPGKQWTSFTTNNSPLSTEYVFDVDADKDTIHLATSNYWFVYYEDPVGTERGEIASLDAATREWHILSGTRKKFISQERFISLPGDVPIPNSNFSNVLSDKRDLWFSFRGGVVRAQDDSFKIYSEDSLDIEFGHVTDMASGSFGLWATCKDGLLQYDVEQDAWIVHQKESQKIPGPAVTSVFVSDDGVWIKSYDPNFEFKQGLSTDPNHNTRLRESSEPHTIRIGGNRVTIRCVDKSRWKTLYNPKFMEFLTVYDGSEWKSWELTRLLIDDLTK